MIKRRRTRTVNIGGVKIGSSHPIAIQSMVKTDTRDIEATIKQINRLQEEGCEIVRIAVKDGKCAKAVSEIKKGIDVPLVADIHFDYKLAVESIKQGADKIRINPGNIKNADDIDAVINAAADKNIPIRVGINSGSLTQMNASLGDSAVQMADAAEKYLERFKKRRFKDIVISLKSSDVRVTRDAYKIMAERCDYPLHVGITAAGLPEDGIVKSSIGIGSLLLDGIGDTIRVSLTGDPGKEISAAKRILKAAGARKFGPEIIACPTCGRCQVDLVPMVKELEERLRITNHESRITEAPLLIAIMGCEVNGPGEAKNADIGIAFGSGKGAIFKNGKIIKTVNANDAVKELVKIIVDRKSNYFRSYAIF